MSTSAAENLMQLGIGQLGGGLPAAAVESFRAAIAADSAYIEAYHGLIRALREAGRQQQSIAAALALTALTPNDPQAHTVLSISLRHGGYLPEAEATAVRARILEWKLLLQRSPEKGSRL